MNFDENNKMEAKIRQAQYQYHEENVKKHPFLKHITINDQDMIDNAKRTGKSTYIFHEIMDNTDDDPNVGDKCKALESFMMLYNKNFKNNGKLNRDPESRPLQFRSKSWLQNSELADHTRFAQVYDCSIFKEIKSDLIPS